jgi:hypothetical protein
MRKHVAVAVLALVAGLSMLPAHADDTVRQQLTAADLMAGTSTGPAPMDAFAPPATPVAPMRSFEGHLTLDAPAFTAFTVLKNQFNLRIDSTMKSMPPVDVDLVQDGTALIPVRRGPFLGAHRDWELLLEPGSVWQEAGDNGLTRASLPFALREVGANCLHNGVLSFVFGDNGAISHVAYQISSETCAYFKFDASGIAAAHFTPATLATADATKTAYRAEVAARLPVRPLSDLIAAHPTLAESGFALAPTPDHDPPTLYGAVIDGVNYVGGCETRAGRYPYCDVLDLPSYSTAKTVFAAVGLMRLEKLWPGARTALIADYVPECATPDWAGVTFENVLNMTSGVFGDRGYEVDEGSSATDNFFNSDDHAGKIRFACRHYKRRAEPGTVWVYRTSDTYVLGTAMQEFVHRHLNADADLYRDIDLAQLWHPMTLSPALDGTLRTYDSVAQPFAGYGLTYHRDDIARIASFLASGATRNNEPMLDSAMLSRVLQRGTSEHGLSAGYPHLTYLDGVWVRDAAPNLGCATSAFIPFMSGYGGISVVLLPDGSVFYYFGDSEIWDWTPAAKEIAKIKPLCR